MEFGVLGPMRVRGGSDAGELTRPMPRALLALLLCRPNEPVSADSLIDELWNGRAATSPRRNLQVHVMATFASLSIDLAGARCPRWRQEGSVGRVPGRLR